MRWVRSYLNLEPGHSTCVYEALTANDIERHSAMAKLPCDSVRLVEEVIPDAVEGNATAAG